MSDTLAPPRTADARARRLDRERWDEVARSMPDLYPAHSTQYYRSCEIALIRRSIGPLRGKRVLKLDSGTRRSTRGPCNG
jgi:hypothetical protein